jgi:hypothetical protein
MQTTLGRTRTSCSWGAQQEFMFALLLPISLHSATLVYMAPFWPPVSLSDPTAPPGWWSNGQVPISLHGP